MATEATYPATQKNSWPDLPVIYTDPDGVGVVYDDQFYLYDEDGERLPEKLYHSSLNRYVYAVLDWMLYERQAAICQFFEYRFDWTLPELQVKVNRAALSSEAEADEDSSITRRAKVEPDLALFLGQTIEVNEASFSVGEDKDLPSPDWLLETASVSTYGNDLDTKFKMYRDALKVKEYVIFDPHDKRLWEGSRLKGWRLENGAYVPLLQAGPDRYWSEVLQSWLVVEDRFLRFYDSNGNRRLTQTEWEQAEKLRERGEKEWERTQKEWERTEKERERAAREAAERRVAELEAKLKALEAGGKEEASQ